MMEKGAKTVKLRLLITFFVLLLVTFVSTPVTAQENTATSTATPTSTPQPEANQPLAGTPSPTPSTSGNITSTPTPTPTATASTNVSEADKQKVLGEATVLGATGQELQIAKIVLATFLGIGALIFGLKLVRENGQE